MKMIQPIIQFFKKQEVKEALRILEKTVSKAIDALPTLIVWAAIGYYAFASPEEIKAALMEIEQHPQEAARTVLTSWGMAVLGAWLLRVCLTTVAKSTTAKP